jgi:hypothetical protein
MQRQDLGFFLPNGTAKDIKTVFAKLIIGTVAQPGVPKNIATQC